MRNTESQEVLSFLVTVFGILCLVGTIITIREYKPQYKDSERAVEYMWGKLNYPATKKITISPDSAIWVSACVNHDTTININRRVFRVKLNVNNVEMVDIYLEEHKGVWGIKKSLKEEQIIRIAYTHF